MSGYKDSAYWASDDEIAAYRERERQASASASAAEPASESQPVAKPAAKPQPAYTSYSFAREGERVYLDVRACQPIKLDGFDI